LSPWSFLLASRVAAAGQASKCTICMSTVVLTIGETCCSGGFSVAATGAAISKVTTGFSKAKEDPDAEGGFHVLATPWFAIFVV